MQEIIDHKIEFDQINNILVIIIKSLVQMKQSNMLPEIKTWKFAAVIELALVDNWEANTSEKDASLPWVAKVRDVLDLSPENSATSSLYMYEI